MSKEIVDRFREFSDKEEEVTDSVEETVSSVLEGSRLSVADSRISNGKIRIELSHLDVVKQLKNNEELDGMNVEWLENAHIGFEEENKDSRS
ncbi:hypothetical protein [Saliphagus sp. LR7]|uniref:hypothetical protein n=1 Tax=Saliphagus sp. LR7 TaxID=2282654 RepID=UPI000DF7893F|nr:hypothetical protein [Saliphagus sp. LR7]